MAIVFWLSMTNGSPIVSSSLFCLPNPNFLVSDLIDKNTNSWNLDLVNAYYAPQNAELIRSTRIPLSGHDRLIWPFTKNSQFSVKSAYKVLSGQIQNPQNVDPVYKYFWKLHMIPKVQIYTWKCYENILPVKSIIYRYNDSPDKNCNLCGNVVPETAKHLILHFPFAQAVWSLTPYYNLVSQVRDSTQNLRECVRQWLYYGTFSDKAVAVFSIAWSIWKDKCSFIFQGKNLNFSTTARLALKLVNYTDTFLRSEIVETSHVIIPNVGNELNSIVSSLPEDCIIIYSDASFGINTNLSGTGLIINDAAVNCIGCKVTPGVAMNDEEAECLALLEASTWEKEMSYSKVYFISDAQLVVGCFNSKNNQPF
ncbi:uncharacterized protein LOC113291311 [Papaver somniferum]|uniref:uncharacterized protein LOC113291311 n=1 Tax=Papaver somniferum TaxID=3469 RepID=UPI000E6F4D29|nr:uncharacterized protein LOC113291311 [Papaver somniferum]